MFAVFDYVDITILNLFRQNVIITRVLNLYFLLLEYVKFCIILPNFMEKRVFLHTLVLFYSNKLMKICILKLNVDIFLEFSFYSLPMCNLQM